MPETFTPERIAIDLKKQFQYVQRIARLVDDILDVSRITEKRLQLHFEEFDLCEMVVDVLSRFKVTADAAGVTVNFDQCADVYGRWDRFRLEQVLLNLLTNAVRYGKHKPIHVEVSVQGHRAILSVRDEGIGIDREDQNRIFERFERAISENEVSGLGLGLYITKEIVESHEGTIQVQSELGKGARFLVSLPLHPEASASLAPN
jgi:signal transduction histidine kinase